MTTTSSNPWDLCIIPENQKILIQNIETKFQWQHGEVGGNETIAKINERDIRKLGHDRVHLEAPNGIDFVTDNLFTAQSQSSSYIEELDAISCILETISSSHSDVTKRTNILMVNCESLLEQQHNLQSTVTILNQTLQPFNDFEEVAGYLGIPFDLHSKSRIIRDINSSDIDPRSQEFQDILSRLSKALLALRSKREFLNSDKYTKWLEQLRHRAVSLIVKAMKELLDSAAKSCVEKNLKGNRRENGVTSGNSGSNLDLLSPVESAPLYQRFRGLGFRIRELYTLIGRIEEEMGMSNSDYEAVNSTKQSYVFMRTTLLIPFLRGLVSTVLEPSDGASPHSSHDNLRNSTGSDAKGSEKSIESSTSKIGSTLCSGIRSAYSSLLRLAHLEQQLYDSLFTMNTSSNEPANDGSTIGRDVLSSFTPLAPLPQDEVLRILQSLCNTLNDQLRPQVIHQTDIDELCRVITTLSEDIRYQIIHNFNGPKPLVKELMRSLNRNISDAQERLSYCAEAKLRLEIQLFDPLPSQLAYPEILEQYLEAKKEAEASSALAAPVLDISRTWYAPLRNTLGLLSKLYGVVEMPVFEDFARRSVRQCIHTLKVGAEGVRKTRQHIHGDLFLIRHLLILREQLLPFETRLQGIEKSLDFKPTSTALSNLAFNAKALWRFDTKNGLLQLAVEGLPSTLETQVDAKRELDSALKNACFALKQSSLKMVLGGLDAFLAKVTAFIGEIPLSSAKNGKGDGSKPTSDSAEKTTAKNEIMLPDSSRASLKNQSFVRPDRIKAVLESVQQVVLQTAPDLREILKLYVENNSTRSILLKPVQQEIETARLRTITVIRSCVDGEEDEGNRKELEGILQAIVSSLLLELSR